MSTTVDERVVYMEFDNKHFEKNVKTSMDTLDKLKQSLNLKGASNGLETVGEAARKQARSFDDLEVASYRSGFHLKDVWLKISSVFEYQVARRIINSAENMVKSLTIDPIKTGLKEYETQLNSVQTILANTEGKGATLKDVNAALDELNAYADKTIYNFTEMTRNIGTFTAAGVELDTSVSAIKGIANLAAVSGSTSQQASTAMYQLSQALASGTVKLMDWNSVVNAGMGGQVFQDALKDTARVHGIAIDDIIEKQGSFRESLSEGWLTSEILTETLAKFTGDLSEEQLKSQGYTEKQIQEIMKLGQTANDAATKVKTFSQLMETLQEAAQSGWAKTWELVFGDFEEAKEFWSKVSKELGGLIGESADYRNNLIAGALNSGWDNFLDKGVMDEGGYQNWIKSVAKGNNIAIDEMVEKYGTLDKAIDAGIKDGTISHEILAEALSHLTEESNTLSDAQLKNLGFTREQVKELTEFNEKIQNGEASIEDFYKKMQRLSGRELLFNIEYDENRLIKYNERTGALVNIYGALARVAKALKDAWLDVFPGLSSIDVTSEMLYQLLDGFRQLTSHLVITDEVADKLRRTFKGVFSVLGIVWDITKALTKITIAILGHLKPMLGGVLSLSASLGDFLFNLRATAQEAKTFEGFSNAVVKNINDMVTKFKEFAATLRNKIDASGLTGFVGFLVGVWNVIKTIFQGIVAVISTIGSKIAETFTGSGVGGVLDLLNSFLMGGLIVGIKKLLDNIGGVVDTFTEILDGLAESLNAFTAQIKAKALENISTSVLLLAAAILVISLIDKEKLERSLAAIAILFTGLMGAMSYMSGGALEHTVVKGGQIIALAAAMLVLASVLKQLSEISDDSLLTGVITITACMLVLTGTLAALSKIKSTRKMAMEGAKQLFKISLALIPTVYVLKQLASVPWQSLLSSFAAMAASLGLFVGALATMAQIKSTKKMATEGAKHLLVISLSLIPLAIAFRMLGEMEWDDIGKTAAVIGAGLIAMVAALGIVALIDKTSNSINKVKIKGKVVIGKCAQLTLIAIALGLLAVTLKVISSMSWEEIGKGLVGVVSTLNILISALKVISKYNVEKLGMSILTLYAMSLMMLQLSGSLGMLGQMDWDTIGKGLLAMAGTMAILGGALTILSKVSKSSVSASGRSGLFSYFKIGEKSDVIENAAALAIFAFAIKNLASSIVILGQLKLETIGKGLLAIAGVLTILGVAGKYLSTSAIGILAVSGAVALLGLSCLMAGMGIAIMAKTLSAFADVVGTAIVAVCKVITENAKLIVDAIITLITEILTGINTVVDNIVNTLLTIILNAMKALSENIPSIAEAFLELLIGVIDEVINYIPKLEDLIVKLLGSIFDLIGNLFDRIDTDALFKAAMAIGILAGIFATLSTISLKLLPKALIGAAGIIALVTLMGVAFGLISKIPGLSDLIGSGGSVLYAIGSAFGMLIGGILSGISGGLSKNIDTAIDVLQKICSPQVVMSLGMMASLVALLNVIGKLKVSARSFMTVFGELGLALGSVVILINSLAALGSIKGYEAYLQRGINILKVICSPDVIASLGMLTGLAAAMALLSKLTTNVGAFVKAAACLSIVIGAITVLVSLLGTIASIPGAIETVTRGTQILETIGSPKMLVALTGLTGLMAILGLVGSMTTYAIMGAAGLAAVVTIIGAFIAALGVLVNELPDIAPLIKDGGDLLQSIGMAIGQFFGGIAAGTTLAIASTLPELGTIFSEFMTNLQPFLEGCKNIDPNILISVGLLAGALLAITAANLYNSILEFFGCEIDWAVFTEQIIGLAQGVKSFSDELSKSGEIDLNTVQVGADAITCLMTAISQLPATGGVKQWFQGEINMAQFNTDLVGLANSLVEFNSTLGESPINMRTIEVASQAVGILATMAAGLPPTGGVKQWFQGNINMGQFGRDLTTLATGLSNFQTAATGVIPEKIQIGVDAIKVLADAFTNIPPVKFGEKIKNFFTGTTKEDDFANNLGILGKGVKEFANNISGITPEEVTAGGNAALALAQAVNNLPADGNVWTMDMDLLKSKFEGLALAVLSFVTNMGKVSDAAIIAAGAKLNKLNQSLSSFSTSGIDAIINTFKNSKSDIASAIGAALESGINKAREYGNKFKELGKELGLNLIEGIGYSKTGVGDQLASILNNACQAVGDSYYNRFYDLGVSLVDGFAYGIDENTYKAVNKATAMAQKSLESAKEVLKINSPSKAFAELGSGCGEGLVGGLDSYMTNVYNAGYNMGDTAVGAMSNSIAKVAQTIENGIDDQITIRPVLDLSEVTNGVNTMNGMLNTNPSIGVMAKVDSISSSMSKNQNGGNSDVVSAIDNLKDTMQTSGNTYNINGITYSDGSEVQNAIETIVRAIIRERRV